MASAARPQVAAHQREVGRLDGDVGAGAHGEAEVGLGERGGVVHAVADHGHDPALVLEAADDVDLVGRQHLGDRPRRCRPRRPPPCAARGVVAGEQDGPQARGRAGRRTASAEVGLTVSATTSTARAAPSQPASDGRARRPPRPGRAAAASVGRQVERPVGEEPRRGRRRRRGRRPRPATPRPCVAARSRRRAAGRRPARGAAGGDGPGDRVLGGVPRARRRGAAPRSAVASVGRSSTSTSAMRPVVTVPVLSSTTVSTRRVDSSTSGPLMRMPSWAPRPVPTSSAVGVARPSAQGQAMISTATAAVNASVGAVAGAEPEPERGDGQGDDGRDEHRRDPVGQPLHGCLAGLRLARPAGAIWASAVSAPTRVARTTRRPPALTVAPDDRVAGADLDRHALAGQQRRRRWPTCPRSTTPSVATFSPGRTTNRSPTASCVDRDPPLDAVAASTATSLAPSSSRAAQRRARAALGPGLEVAPGQDEHGDAGGDLEVDLAGARRRARGREREAMAHAGLAGVAEEQGPQRPPEGGERRRPR